MRIGDALSPSATIEGGFAGECLLPDANGIHALLSCYYLIIQCSWMMHFWSMLVGLSVVYRKACTVRLIFFLSFKGFESFLA